MSAESIKVCCRFRKEINVDEAEFDDWVFDVDLAKIKLREKSWTYDYILGALTEQDEMYEKVGKQTITDFMNGFNGTIFAYGQSGSGKTFSMLGPEDVTEALSKDFKSVPESVQNLYGITPRAVIQMFEMINEFVSQGSQCVLTCSYIELYNEQINCLLSKKENLKIREQPGVGMNVADKESRVCKTPEEIFECVSIATKNRAVGGTNQNARSSRSHTILLLELEYNGVDGVKKSSRLNLVDLAGSERIAKTGAEGQRLKEAQKINQSLTTLGMCIMALTTAGTKHIPFRNSKLTLILKESLGGNSKTTLLCTASRLRKHEEESVQTLYFASRAKAIKNVCKSNVQLSAKELQYLADCLRKEVMTLRAQLKKAGQHWSLITDPKILAFISNDMIETQDSDEIISVTPTTITTSGNVTMTTTDLRAKRTSLIGLTDQDIIMKYLELRAKYDSLLENAGAKIYQLTNQPKVAETSSEELKKIRTETDEKLREVIDMKSKEMEDIIQENETERKAYQEKIDELNEKVKKLGQEKQAIEDDYVVMKKEFDQNQENISQAQNDLTFAQEKLEKKRNKSKALKEENNSLKQEIVGYAESRKELKEKLSKGESNQLDMKQKLDDAESRNKMLDIELENMKNMLKAKDDSEASLSNKNKELQEEIKQGLYSLSEKDKMVGDLNNKIQEISWTYQARIDSLINKENAFQKEIEALQKVNEDLQRLLQEKVSDQDLLAEKEKILNITKANIEERCQEILVENEKIKKEQIEASVTFSTEKSALLLQIETLNREFRSKVVQLEQNLLDSENTNKSQEEKLKGEVQKNELIQCRLDSTEKKIKELETSIYNYSEAELKFNDERLAFEKDIKEKTSLIENQKESIEKYSKLSEKQEKEIQELKEALHECKIKLKEEYDFDKKKLQTAIDNMQKEVDLSHAHYSESEHKITELKGQIKVLQDINSKMQNRIHELELDNNRTKRESVILQKECQTIKEKATLSKNIFGVLLKKQGGGANFLKQAKEENKKIQKQAEEVIFKDNIDFLRGIRENIVSLSPKTVSSRGDMADLPELDFTNEETFREAQEQLLEKEMAYQAKKEMERKEKETSQEMTNI